MSARTQSASRHTTQFESLAAHESTASIAKAQYMCAPIVQSRPSRGNCLVKDPLRACLGDCIASSDSRLKIPQKSGKRDPNCLTLWLEAIDWSWSTAPPAELVPPDGCFCGASNNFRGSF